MAKIDKATRIILSAREHNFEHDTRALIPFMQGSLIGFVDNKKEIIVPAKYEIVLDDFDWATPLIRVGRYVVVSYPSNDGGSKSYIHKRYGLMDKNGDAILPMDFEGIALPHLYSEYETYTVRSLQKGYAVYGFEGEVIVPFGKYDYIDGFDDGYARVKVGSNGASHHEGDKWGIIDENGTEVLNTEYSRIDKFYLKDVKFCQVEKNGEIEEFHLMDGKLKYDGAYIDDIRRLQKEEEDYQSLQAYRESQDYYEDCDMRDSWDAMTDGMYGDMPDGFDGDCDFLGR